MQQSKDNQMEVTFPKAPGTVGNTSVSLNNRGIEHMRAGELGQALHCFRLALWSTLEHCDNLAASTGNETALPELAVSSYTVVQQVTPLSVSNSRSDFFHAIGVYLVPFSSTFCYDCDEFKNTVISSAIIMYNMALLYHLSSSLTGGKLSDERLGKAVLLYQQSKATSENIGFQPRHDVCKNSAQRHAILDVVGMATLNNLGYCLFLQENYTESQRCLDQLEQWVLFLDQQRSIVHDLNSLKVLAWHRCSCLVSVITLKPPKLAAAA